MSEHIEAEVVPTQALAIRPQQSVAVQSMADLEQSFALAVKQRELISDYIKKQLKPDKHFYMVPGSSKPSLNKEGAELILLPHGLVPDYDYISGPQEPPADGKPYQITVKCVLRSKSNPDSFAGSGIGSASSHITTRKEGRKPRQNDIGLCYNATFKMAQKSAMCAAVLNSTAASEFFTQDIEQDVAEPPPQTKAEYRKETVSRIQTPPPVAKPDYDTKETPAQRKERFLAKFKGMESYAKELWVEMGIILPTEDFNDFPEDKVPATAKVVWDMVQEVKKRAGVSEPPAEEPPPSEPSPTAVRTCPNCQSTNYVEMRSGGKVWWKCSDCGRQGSLEKDAEGRTVKQVMSEITGGEIEEDEEWRKFPMPWGKNAGVPLEDLEKNYLFGLWANYEVETMYKGKPKKAETVAKDKKFREMLDACGKHYEFTKKD